MSTYIFLGVDARTVANSLLNFANAEQIPIDPMKMQKLVYLAHGWHLAFTGEPLITQPVEAWKYGPVISDLYSEFKEFGASPITRLARNPASGVLLPEKEAHIQNVWNTYKGFDAIQLSMLTHEQGSAWDRTIRTRISSIIPNAWIAQEFLLRKQQG